MTKIKTKNIYRIIVITALILLIPLVAMQFTDEVNWGVMDFILAGVLIFGTGMVLLIISHKIKGRFFRIAVSLAVIVVFLLIWAELAVGLY